MRNAVLLLAATAVALAPAAAAQAAARYLDQRDVAEAQRQHPQLVAGIRRRRDRAARGLCRIVGRRVAAYSGIANPGQAYHFTTLNRAVENAFAVPGGYVYITRQLMGLMDDEAELAFALGHETGHIAANHAHARASLRRGATRSACSARSSAASSAAARQRDRADAPAARAAGDAELLARPGISGRHARPPLPDRGGLRSGRRPGDARRADPCQRARSARPGPHQPPDAGMGEHPPAEREPDAARARRGARDRAARHRPAQPRPVPRPARRRVSSTTIRRRASSTGAAFTHPDLRIQFIVPPAI